MLDFEKLKTESQTTAAKILELKKIFRESHQPRREPRHHYELKSLKRWATILYSIKAHSHGRLHLKNKTLEEQWELIDSPVEGFQKTQAA